MAKRAIIVHKWAGTPQSDWYPWLARELESRGCQVSVPQLPDTENPKIEPWVATLKQVIGTPDGGLVLAGHSMGCQTILRYLEGLPGGVKIGPVVLVAGFVTLKGLTPEEQVVAKPWLDLPIDWNKVREKAAKFTAIFSTTDPWVPLSDADVLKQKLGAEIVVEKGKGHFSGSDGVRELPSVLKAIS